MICSMANDEQYSLNSSPVNIVPLSLTCISGTPKRLNISSTALRVFTDAGCLNLKISGHLEKLSIMIN